MTTIKNRYGATFTVKHDNLTPNVVKWLEDDERDPGFYSWADKNSIPIEAEDFLSYEQLLDDLEDAGYFNVEDVKEKPYTKLPRGGWFDDMMENVLDEEQTRALKKDLVNQLWVWGGLLLFTFGVYRPIMKRIMKRNPEFDAHVKRHPVIWGRFK